MRVVALEEHCVTPALREVLGVDHPFSDSRVGTRWLADAPIGDGVRAKVAHANADRLRKLAPAERLTAAM